MTWYLCSTSRTQKENWRLCKEVGCWAVTANSGTKADRTAKIGDHLLFWVGGKGFAGYGVVSELPRKPQSKAEAPWSGGTYQYRNIIPFKLLHEASRPIFVPFVAGRQTETDIPSIRFQHGMSEISDSTAAMIVERLLGADLPPD